MSTYEIVRKDGSVSRMRLRDGVNPHQEVAKWSDFATVVQVRPVPEFEERPPEPMIAPTGAATPDEIIRALGVIVERLTVVEGYIQNMREVVK